MRTRRWRRRLGGWRVTVVLERAVPADDRSALEQIHDSLTRRFAEGRITAETLEDRWARALRRHDPDFAES